MECPGPKCSTQGQGFGRLIGLRASGFQGSRPQSRKTGNPIPLNLYTPEP